MSETKEVKPVYQEEEGLDIIELFGGLVAAMIFNLYFDGKKLSRKHRYEH